MKQVDEIIYDAIKADDDLMAAIGGRVVSTCFEVSPTEADKTPVPNIIVTDDGFQNLIGTKDNVWESGEDTVQASVDIAADSPSEVKRLVRMVRKAVETHMCALYASGEQTPELESLTSDGIAWDWMKPCYYQKLTYQCITNTDEDEQEEN